MSTLKKEDRVGLRHDPRPEGTFLISSGGRSVVLWDREFGVFPGQRIPVESTKWVATWVPTEDLVVLS